MNAMTDVTIAGRAGKCGTRERSLATPPPAETADYAGKRRPDKPAVSGLRQQQNYRVRFRS